MNQTYNINDGFDELFSIADNLYDNLKRALVSAEMKTVEHGDIEEKVAGDGLEIVRNHAKLPKMNHEKLPLGRGVDRFLLNPGMQEAMADAGGG